MMNPDLLRAAHQTLQSLAARGVRLSTAESCTGGLIAAALTHWPGSSQQFPGGFVTYGNQAKKSMLGVSPALLTHPGPVSPEVARAMAEGAREILHTECSLSVTGIAGPTGAEPDKPVGTVWFGFCDVQGNTHTERAFFQGTREEIQHQAAIYGLRQLHRYLGTLDGTPAKDPPGLESSTDTTPTPSLEESLAASIQELRTVADDLRNLLTLAEIKAQPPRSSEEDWWDDEDPDEHDDFLDDQTGDEPDWWGDDDDD